MAVEVLIIFVQASLIFASMELIVLLFLCSSSSSNNLLLLYFIIQCNYIVL